MSQFPFNVRVYGIILNEHKQVLLTDEFVAGMEFTKFPGGGLEHGEGTHECLQRECMEELGQPVEVLDHFYTTDYFQPSAFNANHQLISIYYLAKMVGKQQFVAVDEPFAFPDKSHGAVIARWVSLDNFHPDQLKWPVDKKVATLIQERLIG